MASSKSPEAVDEVKPDEAPHLDHRHVPCVQTFPSGSAELIRNVLSARLEHFAGCVMCPRVLSVFQNFLFSGVYAEDGRSPWSLQGFM